MLAVAPPYRNPFGRPKALLVAVVIVLGGCAWLAALKAHDYMLGEPGEKGRGS